jgi:hypothetical protein
LFEIAEDEFLKQTRLRAATRNKLCQELKTLQATYDEVVSDFEIKDRENNETIRQLEYKLRETETELAELRRQMLRVTSTADTDSETLLDEATTDGIISSPISAVNSIRRGSNKGLINSGEGIYIKCLLLIPCLISSVHERKYYANTSF